MKISASVFSNKEKPLEQLLASLETFGVDFLHVDCNDDLGVADSIARMRASSSLPIDLHIISSEPEKFYPMIREYGVEMVTLQYEDLDGRTPDLPDLGCEYGLSITTDTPLSHFAEFEEHCDFILFMTTRPGMSGGTFDKANFRKIRSFRRAFPTKRIHVDGGVNAEISFILRNMGVFCAVSGSFLVNSESIATAFLRLLRHKGTNHLLVSDFMYELDELPVLQVEGLKAGPLLQAIEDHRMGYCLLVDSEGKLAGLVSNADVRRGVLRHLSAPGDLRAGEMINPTPITIHEGASVSEMLRFIKSIDIFVSYLPVVDEKGMLKGAVNFNNLILGEL